MVSATAPGAVAHTNYEYRADGLRVQKSYYSGAVASEPLGGPASSGGLATSSSITATASAGAPVATTSSPTQTTGVGDVLTMYRYDGQMPIETYAAHDDGSSVLTDHGLGERGVDYVQIVSTTTSGAATTTYAYPIYDAHGNEVATLSKSGGTYTLNNQRSYGAWGEIRQGSSTGGARSRYCGQLGHYQDDETGLVYMRARYYDAATGRFISQDRDGQSLNLFAYCGNDPVNFGDFDGCSKASIIFWKIFALGAVVAGLLGLIQGSLKEIMSTAGGAAMMRTGITFIGMWFASGNEDIRCDMGDRTTCFAACLAIMGGLAITLAAIAMNVEVSKGSIAANAVGLMSAYAATIALFMAADDLYQTVTGGG